MRDNTITSTQGETPFATVQLTPNDIQPRDWAFLREWANNLGVSLEELLKRIFGERSLKHGLSSKLKRLRPRFPRMFTKDVTVDQLVRCLSRSL